MMAPPEPITDLIRREREAEANADAGATAGLVIVSVVALLIGAATLSWFAGYRDAEPTRATLECDKGGNVLSLRTEIESQSPPIAAGTTDPLTTRTHYVTRTIIHGACDRLSQDAFSRALDALAGDTVAAGGSAGEGPKACPPTASSSSTTTAAPEPPSCSQTKDP